MNKKTVLKALTRGLIIVGVSILLFPFIKAATSTYMSHALREAADSYLLEGNSLLNTSVQQPSKEDGPEESRIDLDVTPSPTKTTEYQTGLYPEPASELTIRPQTGEIIGKLSIPVLGISEAILEGTGDKELAKSTGHLQDSVFPGQIGTSIIAAHNTTIFRHLDQLTEGVEFTVTTKQGVFTFMVTGQQILKVGDSLANMAYPSVALETCYPLDTPFLTDKRLFVEAALINSELNTMQ